MKCRRSDSPSSSILVGVDSILLLLISGNLNDEALDPRLCISLEILLISTWQFAHTSRPTPISNVPYSINLIQSQRLLL